MNRQLNTTRDILYSERKATAFQSKEYEFVKNQSPSLHKPLFTIKNLRYFIADITYRKINGWDEKGLVSGSRDNADSGWRKFSIIDTIKLNIISDLRKIGLSTDKIKFVIDGISNSRVSGHDLNNNIKHHKFLELEYWYFACLADHKILFLIDDEGSAVFLEENDALWAYTQMDNSVSPLLILPFFSYVKKITSAFGKNIRIKEETTLAHLFKNKLTEQEEKILGIIRDQCYEEILIKKSNNENIHIKAKSRRSGNFSDSHIIDLINKKDYQNITVTINGGKKVSLTQEDNIKI